MGRRRSKKQLAIAAEGRANGLKRKVGASLLLATGMISPEAEARNKHATLPEGIQHLRPGRKEGQENKAKRRKAGALDFVESGNHIEEGRSRKLTDRLTYTEGGPQVSKKDFRRSHLTKEQKQRLRDEAAEQVQKGLGELQSRDNQAIEKLIALLQQEAGSTEEDAQLDADLDSACSSLNDNEQHAAKLDKMQQRIIELEEEVAKAHEETAKANETIDSMKLNSMMPRY